jgi:hypothetical protein
MTRACKKRRGVSVNHPAGLVRENRRLFFSCDGTLGEAALPFFFDSLRAWRKPPSDW